MFPASARANAVTIEQPAATADIPPGAALRPALFPTGPPVAETSWLDAPGQEYPIEMPDHLADRAITAQTAAVFALMEAARRGDHATPGDRRIMDA